MPGPFSPDPFTWAEPAAIVIMAAYFAVRFSRGKDEGWAFVRDYLLVAPAAFIAEDTCIRLFGFYGYADGWHLFLDRVPVMVALIWPFVILSARGVARRLAGGRPLAEAAVGGAIVVTDAALIEAVATSTGLWAWNEPGPFGVPFMGFFGWGCFAAACIYLMGVRGGRLKALIPMLAPVLTHALLVAWWWGLFRWITTHVDEGVWAACTAVFCMALAVPCFIYRNRVAVPLYEMASRFVAALYFFAMLLMYHTANTPLLVFTFAFAPPWLALMARRPA